MSPSPPPPDATFWQPSCPGVPPGRGGPLTLMTDMAVIVTVEKDWIQISPPEPEPPRPETAWAVAPWAPSARILPSALPEPWMYGPTQEMRRPPPPPPPPPPWSSLFGGVPVASRWSPPPPPPEPADCWLIGGIIAAGIGLG